MWWDRFPDASPPWYLLPALRPVSRRIPVTDRLDMDPPSQVIAGGDFSRRALARALRFSTIWTQDRPQTESSFPVTDCPWSGSGWVEEFCYPASPFLGPRTELDCRVPRRLERNGLTARLAGVGRTGAGRMVRLALAPKPSPPESCATPHALASTYY